MTIPAADIIANWRFNGDGVDASGNGHTAVPVGAIYNTIDPKLGSACAQLDGLNDNFVVADDDALTLSSGFGIAFWPKPDSTDAGGISYIQKYDTGKREFAIRANPTNNILEANVYDESTNGFMQRTWTAANINDDNYHLILVNWDGGTLASGLTMEVDTVVRGNPNDVGSFVSMRNLDADLEIGGSASLGYSKCLMDEPLIINRPFTTAEKAWVWNGGAGQQVVYGANGFPFFFDAGHY